MPLSDEMLEIIACPACHGRLVPEAARDALVCPPCRLRYPASGGIALLVADRAEPLDPEER